MNEDISDIQYSPIRNYDFAQLFESMNFNGKTLSSEERKQLVEITDETIHMYSSGLPQIQEIMESSRNLRDEFNTIEYTVASVMLFTILTLTDCLVAGKYFVLADTDYDRRFMRGKMKVILNEGFKRLYGFEKNTRKNSEWARLKPLMEHFPTLVQRQYEELTDRLDRHAQSSSWWKDERDLETHMDAEKLYLSRQEEIIESKVMMENLKLYNTLLAVNEFLTNVHACLLNFLHRKIQTRRIATSNFPCK